MGYIKCFEDYILADEKELAYQNEERFKEEYADHFPELTSLIQYRGEQSKICKYWNNVLNMISLMHDLILADRTGNFSLHFKSIQKLQPIFSVMDRMNYFRWSSVYTEDMLSLKDTARELHAYVNKGGLTVKKFKYSKFICSF